MFTRLIREWQVTYYTDAALFVTLIVTLLIVSRKRKKIPELKLIRVYLILFIALTLSSYYSILVNGNNYQTKVYESILPQEYIVAIVEYSTFVFYGLSISKIRSHRIAFRWLGVCVPTIFAIAFVASFFGDLVYKYIVLHHLFLVEEVGLLISCTLYFLELFKRPPEEKLINSPSFWIFSGLTFYTLCTLPITVISPHLIDTQKELYIKMFSTVYLFYIILFVMIIKGFLCKEETLT